MFSLKNQKKRLKELRFTFVFTMLNVIILSAAAPGWQQVLLSRGAPSDQPDWQFKPASASGRISFDPDGIEVDYNFSGGTGFIGQHLVGALCADGRRVRLLTRRSRLPEAIAGLDIDVVQGDGPMATAWTVKLEPFTLVGATTRAGRCSAAPACPPRSAAPPISAACGTSPSSGAACTFRRSRGAASPACTASGAPARSDGPWRFPGRWHLP